MTTAVYETTRRTAITDDDEFCHLKNPITGQYACGRGFGVQHHLRSEAWRSGYCDRCGKPICPDCIEVKESRDRGD